MKRFNLLFDSWIPIKTRQGENRSPIKAYEIVQKDIVALDTPRADFNAALMQFLIGLLQTVFAPADPRAWRKFFNQPPSENQLKEKFGSIKEAFYLDGDGYRFMQDALAKNAGKRGPIPIEEIVFGAPGESGKNKNQDHFIKQNNINNLCYSCVASALLTANIFSEDGGQSYFPSMRGNGFVSTLILLDENQSEVSLWKNLWLNILEDSADNNLNLIEKFFWLKDLPDKLKVDKLERIKADIKDLKARNKRAKSKNEKKQIAENIKQLEIETKKIIDGLNEKKIIYPANNSLQVYWAWMRRFFLDTENTMKGQCSLCSTNDELIRNFFKTNKGYKYPKEEWQYKHPFSPSKKYQRKQYNKNNIKYKGKMLAIEMTQNGLPYTYWQDFVIQTEKQASAKVVNRHLKEKRSNEQLIIWSFGYAMDKKSSKGWYETKTPFYLLEEKKHREVFEAEIDRYIQASNKIANVENGYLSVSIRMAWFDYDYWKEQEKKRDKKPDPFYNNASKSFYNQPAEIAKCFWNNTERKFYEQMKALYDNANQFTDEKRAELRQDWYEHIKYEAKELFDRWAFRASIQTNPRRIAKAHNQLMKNLNSKSLKQAILGLPKENK
jgi:CRISPR system Cascade subunit CasA